MKALVIHGPNLNLLGTREPDVYGSLTLADLDDLLRRGAGDLEIEIEIHQTAREGEFIELLHAGIGKVDGAVVNPGAYSHTSRAIADAIRAVPYPVVEVHLSNIHAREPWRRHSVTAEAAAGVIAGLGPGSYLAGLAALKALTEGKGES
ncbi:MAG: 3-dehydroquinate dehydratase [Actinomycetota bacterium]|nr:3-dehydroquinate dehydratase [Actinomycetota bacterium]